jgi:AraC-like DNA-binding protein
MPKSTPDVHLDFAACWNVDGSQHYRYRVPCCQLILVESGRLWARHQGRLVGAGAGDLLCLERETLNEYGWDAPARFWEAHLTIEGGLRIEGKPPPAVVPLLAHREEARAAWESWCLENSRPGDLAALRVRAATYRVLAALAAALGRAPVRRPRDPWQVVRDRLERQLGRPLQLAEVARDAGVTPDHLIREFRRHYGLAPMAWRARATLRQACVLLDAGRQVKDVAHRLGFTNASAFTRAFRRQFGITPTQHAVHERPAAPSGDEELGFPLNRHVQPPDATGPWFTWG